MRARTFAVEVCRWLVMAALAGCLPAGAQAPVAIHTIMTNLPNSPLLGQAVSVSGVVVGVLGSGGFYLTGPNAAWDTNPATAEGIEIYAAAGANPACAVVGNVVTVVGTVLNGAAVNGANTPGTGIQPASCAVTGTGSVSNTVTLGSASSYGQDLPVTGTPVANTVFYAISPTGGTTDPATGLVTSTGQFWVDLAVPVNGHLFKSAGLEADNFYPPPPAPLGIPTWNGNPQRLLIDTASFGGAPVDLGAGQTLTCRAGAGLGVGATAGVGVVDYSLGYNRLLLFKTTTCTVSGSVAPSITSPADSAHFHVGTLNLNNFAGAGSPAYNTRLAKAALAIVNVFGKPDILSVQEVQDLPTLQAIGNAASALAGSGTVYQAYVAPANDVTNLSLGFLVNTQNVSVSKIYQVNATDTFTLLNGSSVPLWERPPYVLEAGLLRAGQNYQVEVVNIETTGRAGIDDPVNGPNVWERRGLQAAELSVFAEAEQTRGQNLLIAGEFNAYSFSDGFGDITDVVDGVGSPGPGSVAQYEPTVTSPKMYNFVNSITVANSTYNVLEQGNARSIEHVLCSETQNTSASGSIYSYISFVTQPHWTTDFPAVLANDPTTPAGLTARDGFVGAFLIPPVPTTASLTPANVNFGNVYRTPAPYAVQTLTFTNTSTFPSTVNVTGVSISGANAADFQASSNCAALAQGASCTVTVGFGPLAAGPRNATLTVTSDSGAEPTLTATLTGVGLDTTATLTPSSATYAAINVGTTSAAQVFTWTNTSPLPLDIGRVGFGVRVSGDFAVTANNCSLTIAAGASCSVAVAFAPTTSGTRTGTLTIVSTSSADGTLTAALTGTGVANIVAAPASLDFGKVDLGATASPQAVVITNYSQHTIGLGPAGIGGDFAYASGCGSSLVGGAQCSVLVSFSPTALGARTGTFTLATNDPGIPVLSVPLAGTGVDFSLAVAPGSGTVIAGLALNFTAALSPLAGYSGVVSLGCAPPVQAGGSACFPANSRRALSSAANTQTSITTTAQYAVIGYTGFGSPRSLWWTLAAGLSSLLLLAGRRRTRSLRALLLLLALVGLGAAGLGCSGKRPGRNANPTYPGTYLYTVTATDGILTHSATFSLTVTAK